MLISMLFHPMGARGSSPGGSNRAHVCADVRKSGAAMSTRKHKGGTTV